MNLRHWYSGALLLGACAFFAIKIALAQASLFGASWILSNSPDLDFNFTLGVSGQYYQANNYAPQSPTNYLTTIRACTSCTATDLLPTSSSGYAYQSYAANTPRVSSGIGLIVEESRVNRLLNSAVPATQTTASLATGTYTLWVNGSGSATSSAGSATGTGYGTATQGSSNTIVLTGAGTVVVTVSGSLNAFQLELGTFGTSLITTTAAVGTRAADVGTVTNLPTFGSAYTIYASGKPQAPSGYASNQTALTIDAGDGNNRLYAVRNASTGLASGNYSVSGSGVYSQNSAGVWAPATLGKIAVSAQSGTQNAAFNGAALTAGTGVGTITPTAVRIGTNPSNGAQFNGPISRIAVWATIVQSTTVLQTITSGSSAANDNAESRYAANDNVIFCQDILKHRVWQ